MAKRIPIKTKVSRLIPKETELLGRKIKVLINSKDVITDRAYGIANRITSEVHIATMIDGNQIPPEEQEITYFHEIFHLILAKNNYEEKLAKASIDLEDIVEDLAVGIHQILTKAKS